MYLKKHRDSGIIALCDKELIGRVLEEGEVFLDLEKHRKFYMGEEKGPEEAKNVLMDGFSSINAVGKESVGIVLGLGLCEKKSVKMVGGIPYIQVYVLT